MGYFNSYFFTSSYLERFSVLLSDLRDPNSLSALPSKEKLLTYDTDRAEPNVALMCIYTMKFEINCRKSVDESVWSCRIGLPLDFKNLAIVGVSILHNDSPFKGLKDLNISNNILSQKSEETPDVNFRNWYSVEQRYINQFTKEYHLRFSFFDISSSKHIAMLDIKGKVPESVISNKNNNFGDEYCYIIEPSECQEFTVRLV